MRENEKDRLPPERTSGDADASEACVVCESPIEAAEWHPVATEWDADGGLSLYAFCSRDCREAWDDP